MAVAAFDTFKYAKLLKKAGFSDEQVEAQVVALAEALQSGFQELAAKQDVADVKKDIVQVRQELAQVKQELKQDIAQVKQELKSDIKQVETQLRGEMLLLKWMFGGIFTALIAILIRSFFRVA